MKIQPIKTKTIYMIIVILFFLMPLLLIPFSKSSGLVGTTQKSHVCKLNLHNWCDNSFQKSLSQKFNEKFGLRDFFIRLNNQVYYSLFKESYAQENILVGKKNYLYTKTYIDAYINPFKGEKVKKLEKNVIKIKTLQDRLKKRGIPFLVVITPTKPSVYPEYMPEPFEKKAGVKNSYDVIIPLLDKYKVDYIDADKLIMQKKAQSKYPLFCACGFHWNYLGAYYFTNVFINKMEALIGKDITNIYLKDIKPDYKPTTSEQDLASLLNTIVVPNHYISPHPVIGTIPGKSGYKPNILFVSGSFSEIPMGIMWENKITDRIDYYAYYKVIHIIYKSEGVENLGSIKTESINWEKDIFSKDLIVLEINTEAIISYKHYYTFVDDALKHLN